MKQQSISSWNRILAVLLIAVMLLAATPIVSASADATGYSSPTRAISNGRGWLNPVYALASDNLYAVSAKNNKQLKLTSFYIPAIQGGAIIDGIEVTVEGLSAGKQVEVAISPGSNFSNPATTPSTTTFTGIESTQTFGGATDKWGKNWSATDFQNKFTVRLTVTGTGGAVSIDRVQVKVHFTPPNTILSLTPVSGLYDGTTTMTARLTVLSNGNPLQDKTVSFSLNGASMGSAITDADGYATLSNVSLVGIAAGSYPYGAGASFAGDNPWQGTSITSELRVQGVQTTLTMNPVSGVYRGTSGAISANLTETVGGAAVSGKTVNFYLDEVLIGSAITDGSGLASMPGIDLSGYDAGSYAGAFEATYAGELNIEPSSDFGDLTVTPKPVTVTGGLVPANKTYDGTTNASLTIGSPTLSGVVSPDVATLNTTGATGTFSDQNVGDNKTVTISGLALEGSEAANYAITPPTRQANIALAPLTVTANNHTKTIGQPDPTFTFSYSGFVNGETSAVLTTQPTCGVSVPHAAAGTYPIVCSGGADDNYSFTYVNGTLTVNAVMTQTFDDVPTTYWAWNFVERLYSAGITGGCAVGPLRYCPGTPVTRDQMAVFLLRGIHGSSYTPPAVGATTGFGDVPTTHWAAAWIKQLAVEGITGGCGSGNYCPGSAVTRDQMAVFLLKAKYGASYTPPAVAGDTGFTDVLPTHWAAAWIKQLAAEGITGGCGTGTYCPGTPVTRDQMAVFLVRTFNLP